MKRIPARLTFSPIAAAFLFFPPALFSNRCEAAWLRNQFEGTRPVGMGNAFLAISDDKNALWYNPAGLGFLKKSRIDFNDFILGVDSADTLTRIQNGALKGDLDSMWRPDTQMGRFSFSPAYYGPYFGLSAYYHAFGFSDLENFNQDEVDIYAVSDVGIVAAVGIPFHRNFSAGFSLRGLSRQGVDTTQSGRALAESLGITQAALASALFSSVWPSAKKGYGLGVNAGLLWRTPRLSLAVTAEDIGTTTFRGINGGPSPPPIRSTYHLGIAMTFPQKRGSVLQFAFDLRHLLESVTIVKQTHLGFEWSYGKLSLRAGVNQGYLTAGLGINTDLFKVTFATYATELGDSLWDRSQRWYQLQLVFGTALGSKRGSVFEGW